MEPKENLNPKTQLESHVTANCSKTEQIPIPTKPKNGDIVYLHIESIQIPPNLSRTLVEDEDQINLTESIKVYDLINPITVAYADGKYSLTAGRRRLHAAQAAGHRMILCTVKTGDPSVLSLIENIHRKNLTPIQEAEAVLRLKKHLNVKQTVLAKKLNKSTTNISNILSLNKLPTKIKDACRNESKYSRTFYIEILQKKTQDEMIKYFDKLTAPPKLKSPPNAGENSITPSKPHHVVLEKKLISAIATARKIAANRLKSKDIEHLNSLYDELGMVLGRTKHEKFRTRNFFDRIQDLILEKRKS